MNRLAALALVFLTIPLQPAAAMTAAEVQALEPGEQAAFLTGALGMAFYLSPDERSACIQKNFFQNSQEANSALFTMFSQNPDKQALIIMLAQINHVCGK